VEIVPRFRAKVKKRGAIVATTKSEQTRNNDNAKTFLTAS
jgi:hypothetical protein